MTGAVACSNPSPSREVLFPTADGGTVVADFHAASGSDAVVLAHGAAFDKASWASFASWLADRGHQVLLSTSVTEGRRVDLVDAR
jgi:predicted alpha/beta hydrolase